MLDWLVPEWADETHAVIAAIVAVLLLGAAWRLWQNLSRRTRGMEDTRTADLIQTSESYFRGVCWSALTAIVAFALVYGVLNYVFDFWYIGEVLGITLGFVSAVVAGFLLFTGPGRQQEVTLKWQGVPTFLNDPAESGPRYDTGQHWVGPLWGIMEVPGPDEIITMDLPGENINTQDGSVILFGRHDNPSESKPNRSSFRVVNPFRYVRVRDFKQQYKSLYNGLGRVFFGQMQNAYAVKNERTLFEEYLELPAECNGNENHPAYQAFRNRLFRAMYQVRGEWKPIFARDVAPDGATMEKESNAIKTIMSRAGEFRRECARWGVGDVEFFPTNVRVDPRLEEASTEEVATNARMAAAQEQAKNIKDITRDFTKEGVTPNLAALIATDRVDPGSDVKLEHVTRDFPQINRENIEALVEAVRQIGQGGRGGGA